MNQGFQFYGSLGGDLQYRITLMGPAAHPACYEEQPGNRIRILLGSVEFQMDPHGLVYLGPGGIVCPHMFGIEMTPSDLQNKVPNRLILFGAYHDPTTDRLSFTEPIAGHLTIEDLFVQGHAVKNYLFLTHSPRYAQPRERQQWNAKRLGKALRRAPEVNADQDLELLRHMLEKLDDPMTSVLLVRLLNIRNARLEEALVQLVNVHHATPDRLEIKGKELAETFGIARYQLERIKLNVLFHHPTFHPLIQEYITILSQHRRPASLDDTLQRLQRLRTIGLRHHLPMHLFDILDEIFRLETRVASQVPAYVRKTESLLGKILSPAKNWHWNPKDLETLLWAKKQALIRRDKNFEELLLDFGRRFDEDTRRGRRTNIAQRFHTVIDLFQSFETCAHALAQLAYMEETTLRVEVIQKILDAYHTFQQLRPRLFQELFVDDILADPYLPRYGKKKLTTLLEGLERIQTSRWTVPTLARLLRALTDEEALFNAIDRHLRELHPDFYWDRITPQEAERYRNTVEQQIRQEDPTVSDPSFFRTVFEAVLFNLKKESIYRHQIFPQVLQHKDLKLRERYIRDSGLDRLRIEQLEQEWMEQTQTVALWLEQSTAPTMEGRTEEDPL